MAISWNDLRRELPPMLRLGTPLALAELGWMAMGVVDTVMAGPLGPAAVGAGALGSTVFYPVVVCGTGLLLGMDTLVAQSHGAEDSRDCRRTLAAGVWLAAGLSPLIMLMCLALVPVCRASGTNPLVLAQFAPFLRALTLGIPPLLLYTAFRRYLQAVNIVKPVTFALVSANAVNFLGNRALMFGRWGFPAMGLEGSGWSTTVSRIYMAAVLLAAIVWHERRSGRWLLHISWRPEAARIRRLVELGFPAAGQLAAEGAVFGAVTVLAARLQPVALAAHGIAVQVISTTFMVPLGISSAAAVRVGQAFGRRDARGVAAAGWAALAWSGVFMGAAGVVLWLVPGAIVRAFIGDAAVIEVGAVLLRIAAFFELFDGFQVVATGALRGLGDTRTPMAAHFTGYWLVGLPVSWVLCFPLGWGAAGIWVGLSAALILIGAALVLVWRLRLRQSPG